MIRVLGNHTYILTTFTLTRGNEVTRRLGEIVFNFQNLCTLLTQPDGFIDVSGDNLDILQGLVNALKVRVSGLSALEQLSQEKLVAW